MNTQPFPNEAQDVTVEACAWIAQLETGRLTAADREAFREWMSRSPRHAAEISRVAGLSMELNVLAEMGGPVDEAAARCRSVIRRKRGGFGRWSLAAVAATVGLAAASALLWLQQAEPGRAGRVLISTEVGEQREVTLSDGTLVKLNTDSRLEVDYDDARRIVRLLRGEAFFDVARSAKRPFLVYAGDRYVRAVGTAFVVRFLERDLTVTVVEGRIAVDEATAGRETSSQKTRPAARAGSASIQPIFLEAGQSLSIPASSRATRVVNKTERDLKRELSWQEGLHDFSDTPLEEVLREVSRYSPLEVRIANAELRDIRFGGIFRTGETKPLLDALESSYGVDVEYIDENTVRLSLAPPR